MTIGFVDSVVGPRHIPDVVRRLSSLPDMDYGDVFTLTTGAVATPEQWARAMFGNVPDATAILIWRGLLGLRLRPGRSPTTVAGWPIADRGEDWIRLENASWFLTGNLVVHVGAGHVSLGTFLRYDPSPGTCRVATAVGDPSPTGARVAQGCRSESGEHSAPLNAFTGPVCTA